MLPLRKKGFTLVELIVVITILAILGTIAFISFQGYSKSARDSARISDLNSVNTGLELFVLQTGYYPEPSNGSQVTFSGSELWTQGNLGDSVVGKIQRLSKKPVDPLTENEYTYSRLNTKKEYELSAVLEDSNVATISQGYAAGEGTAHVTGTYNGVVAKVSTGGTIYMLAVPGIISTDLSEKTYEGILNTNKLVLHNKKNLPSSYSSTSYDLDGGFDEGIPNPIVYSSGAAPSNQADIDDFISSLQSVYQSSNITGGNIDFIVNTVSSTQLNVLGNKYVDNIFGEKKSVASNDLAEEGSPSIPTLVETGANGSIALVGTNGLTESSYTAGSAYGTDPAVAAFDGYDHSYVKQNADAGGSQLYRGAWISNSTVVDDWIQVDFGQEVNIAGFRVINTVAHAVAGWGPKDVRIQLSSDAGEPTDYESFTLSVNDSGRVNLSTPTTAQKFRLYVEDNHAGSYIFIDELEIYQD